MIKPVVYFTGNTLNIEYEGRQESVVVPPANNGIDIIDFGMKKNKGYTFDYKGIVVITTEGKRSVYYKGIKL